MGKEAAGQRSPVGVCRTPALSGAAGGAPMLVVGIDERSVNVEDGNGGVRHAAATRHPRAQPHNLSNGYGGVQSRLMRCPGARAGAHRCVPEPLCGVPRNSGLNSTHGGAQRPRDRPRRSSPAGPLLALSAAVKTKGKIVERIIELLTVHTCIENEVMYPEVCALLPDLKDDVLESYEEHHVADVLCMELAGMSAGAERFDAKTTVLIENVTHHIEEESRTGSPKCGPASAASSSRNSGPSWSRPGRMLPGRPRSPAR